MSNGGLCRDINSKSTEASPCSNHWRYYCSIFSLKSWSVFASKEHVLFSELLYETSLFKKASYLQYNRDKGVLELCFCLQGKNSWGLTYLVEKPVSHSAKADELTFQQLMFNSQRATFMIPSFTWKANKKVYLLMSQTHIIAGVCWSLYLS